MSKVVPTSTFGPTKGLIYLIGIGTHSDLF